MNNIFFSYGHDNHKDFILKIKDYLTKNGFNVFVDSDKLRAGNDWEYQLEVAIDNHSKFLFFITPHSARRPDGYCLNEIAMALYKNKKIIPIMIDFEIPPLSIVRQQYLDLQKLTRNTTFDNNYFEQQMKHLIEVLKGEINLDFQGVQSNIFKQLNPLDFTQDFANHSIIIGREWVKEEINSWIKNHSKSRVLWITAEAGYGKSAIATNLARTFKNVLGIHYCSYNYKEKNNPINIIKTLAFQIQSQLPNYIEQIKDLELNQKNEYHLFESLIINPLNKIKISETYYFIIDALDEATDENGKNKIVKLIRDEFHKLPNNIKIIITSRPDPKLRQILSFYSPIELNAINKKNKIDCINYIKHKLLLNGLLKKVDDKTFVDKLLTKSENNMLYLNTFFKDVERKNIDIDKPESFPIGLNGIYSCFIERFLDDSEFDSDFKYLIEILLGYEDDNYRVSKTPTLIVADILKKNEIDIIKSIQKKIGHYFTIDSDYIKIYHKSFKDWLLMNENTQYRVDSKRGEEKIISFCKKLKPESYKEKYLEFKNFNYYLLLIIFNETKNINSFFELMKPQKDEEKVFKLLMGLSHRFPNAHRKEEAYLSKNISKFLIKVSKKNYQVNPEIWTEKYLLALSTLARVYSKGKRNEKKLKKSIRLYETKIQIILNSKTLESDKWLENLSINFYNFSVLLHKYKKFNEAIIYLKKYLKIENKGINYFRITMVRLLADCYYEIGEYNKAIDLITNTINLKKITPNELENSGFTGLSIKGLLSILEKNYDKTDKVKMAEEIKAINNTIKINSIQFKSNMSNEE